MSKVNINQLDKAETLPFRCNNFNNRKYRHYFHSENNPWKIVKRVLNNNIDKSFALAFSYYCSKVEQRYYKEFLEEFYDRGWRWIIPNYYIDDNGLIQTNIKPKEKKPIIIYSKNYKTELRHKITGDKKVNFKDVYKDVKYIAKYGAYKGRTLTRPVFSHLEYGAKSSKVLPIYLRYKAQESDFENVIISGYKQVFESKNDPRYIRIIQESIKKQNLEYKRNKKIPKLSNEDFRRLLKEKELKERQLNLIKIESHGFDVLTSFRKLKTN